MYPVLFVFDMIGTTIQPSDAIPDAFQSAFAANGIRLSGEQITAIRGKSKREGIAELLTQHLDQDEAERLQDRVYDAFRTGLIDHYRNVGVQPIECATETFAWCRSVGAGVALTTGFDRNVAELLIGNLGWAHDIDALVCNDDVAKGRPAPFLIQEAMKSTGVVKVDRVASVGDTVSDLQAGVNAGVGWNFAVLSGAHARERLMTVDGAAILDSIANLPTYGWQFDASY